MREMLTDGVINLHRYTLQDADDLHTAGLESVKEVYPWLPWCRPGYTLEEAASWITGEVQAWEEGRNYEFVIRTQEGAHVGAVGLNGLHHVKGVANLGYWVRTSQTGRGYASRAARLLGEFGLQDLKLKRLEIVACVTNVASIKVAEKSGALREGILRNRIQLHGKSHDAVMHSLIP